MNAAGEGSGLHQEALDWLFTRLGGNPAPEPAAGDAEPHPAATDCDEPEAMPAIRSAEDLRVANEWLQRERQRLAAYTRAQMSRIQQEHQALIQQSYLNEQRLILRSQELARKEEAILAQGQAIQQQGADLMQLDMALVVKLQQLCHEFL
jgi:hypothetical protein